MSDRETLPVELVCLDMAGTTVGDGGAVEEAFVEAIDAAGVGDGPERDEMLRFVRDTMGTSKIEVFRSLFGDEGRARGANESFERAYRRAVASGRVAPLPGASEAIAALRSTGCKVALTTGFSVTTRDEILDELAWRDLVDLALCPEEAGRGRPYPDLVLAAVLRLGVGDVAAVAVVGDTAADLECGRRAGASVRAGVLTGADDAGRLAAAGATHVLRSVGELPELLAGPVLPGAEGLFATRWRAVQR
ncbi:MAG: phosphonatase-like hydrolase [Actinomycetota bacterium]|nr:phosphonatase-like hydrolase [Actinomycetota bacterium]